MPKVGDKFLFYGDVIQVIEVPPLNGCYPDHVRGVYLDGDEGLFSPSNIKDASGFNVTLSTTFQEVENKEVQDVMTQIDDAIFYDGFQPAKSLAKANEVIAALVQVLVAKDLISAADVSRILKQVPAFTNVQPSKED
jgi:hypothetical protein